MTLLSADRLSALEELAINVAEQAGSMALSMAVEARNDVSPKSDGSIVTTADPAVEAFIRDQLAASFPAASFMGEETGGVPEGLCWVVDPIDGTSNFAVGLPFWCVSIALMKDGLPIAAAVHDPNLGETFSASRGNGARLDGLELRPAEAAQGSGFAACLGFPRSGDPDRIRWMLERVRSNGGAVRSHGATALSMAYVAAGRIGLIVEPSIHLWDVAAAQLLVTESGGGVFSTGRHDLPKDGFSVCAYRSGLRDVAEDLFLGVIGTPDAVIG